MTLSLQDLYEAELKLEDYYGTAGKGSRPSRNESAGSFGPHDELFVAENHLLLIVVDKLGLTSLKS